MLESETGGGQMKLRNAPVAAILPVTDMERAIRFYTETLDLPMTEFSVPNTVTIECGDGTRIGLYQRDEPTRAEHTVAGWLVEDVEATVDALRERGVTFEQYDRPGIKTDARGIVELGGAKGAWFKDSEGNILSITEEPE
jgi:predicted enzyme related to lactoylglutathione lyase